MRRKSKKNKKLVCVLCLILGILVGVVIGIVIEKKFINKEKIDKIGSFEDNENSTEIVIEDNNKNNYSSQVENNRNTDTTTQIEEELNLDSVIKIETLYCSLYFPEKYKDSFEVRYIENSCYKAEFYGLLEGKEPQHVFDVCFNSDDGDLLGYLENGDEIVNISIDVMDLEFDDTWTQDEIDYIFSIQEEMNFVMNTLSNNENYVQP